MPDVLDADGLQTKDLTELKTELQDALKAIYGTDINLEQNSPDGQMSTIYSQGGVDIRELLQMVNASFDPDQAEGRVLDQRVGINYIERAGGTYTTVNIDIVTSKACNLVGLGTESGELNPDVENLYTVKDDEGNLFYLLDDEVIAGAGTTTAEFRSAAIGNVEITVNTITTVVTVVDGVTSVNNPGGAVTQGQDEESDIQLRTRRRRSVNIKSCGNVDAIQAALEDVDGVTVAKVYENDTGVTDADGTPAHTIWCIVDGGSDEDVATVIYAKRSGGCGMRGAESYNVPRAQGGTKTIYWDRPDSVNGYIELTITFSGVLDEDYIKAQIVENVVWGVGESMTADRVTSFVKSINSDYVLTSVGVSSDGITYSEVVATAAKDDRYINATTRISLTVV